MRLTCAPIDKKTFRKLPVSLDYGSGIWPISDASPLFEPAQRDAEGMVEIRLRMAKTPTVVNVKVAGRVVEAERTESDGWLALRFPARHKGEVKLLGTDTPESSTRTVFAVFEVQ